MTTKTQRLTDKRNELIGRATAFVDFCKRKSRPDDVKWGRDELAKLEREINRIDEQLIDLLFSDSTCEGGGGGGRKFRQRQASV
jgi:hypothetical protein